MSEKLRAVPTLAKRFLLSKSSDGFLSLITWVSVVGVSLGVLALTVVTSVINGFEGELSKVISGLNGDVVLYSRAEPVSGASGLEAKIKTTVPQTEAVTASLITELMASGPLGTSGIVLEGIDGASVGAATTLPSRMWKGRLPENDTEIVLGSVVAEKLGVGLADPIKLIIPSMGGGKGGDERSNSSMPKIIDARVIGIIKIGMHEYDAKYAFGTLSWVQKVFSLEGKVSTFKIRLKKGTDEKKASDQLGEVFGYPFRSKDWSQLNRNLLYAIQLEKIVIAIILMAIIVVAAFNVVSTLMMMIHDKTKEIAILKAMGFRFQQSFGLFCLIGMGIGVVGTGVGIGVGLLINFFLDSTQLIRLPSDIYYIGFLPVSVNWNEILLIGIAALVITFAATIYPAFRVSTQSPMDGIRYE